MAIKAATLRAFRRYHKIVQGDAQSRAQALKECVTVICALTDGKAESGAVWLSEAAEIIFVGRQINTLMCQKIPHAMNVMAGGEPVEVQKSAFDEYDREHGYEDDAEKERREMNISAADAVIRAAVNVCGCSFTEAADENVFELLEHIDYELKNRKE